MGQLAPPPVNTPQWADWYQSLLASRLAACPLVRGTVYYFSQSGSDVDGDGTSAHPWKTLAQAQALLDASPGDVALLFERGGVWREPVGLNASAPNVTISDYGAGDKPLFTAFEPAGDPAQWAPVSGLANTYARSVPLAVTWAKEDDDLDRPYARQSSLPHVEATEGSFWWDESSATLYVHPKHNGGPVATDPRTDGKSYELVHERGSGVIVSGDGSRLENIRAQGWGMTTGPITQEHGIESRAVGGARVVINGCESHYGMTHTMTHWASQGGLATFVDCRAGLTTYVSDGGTEFNTYARYGEQQTIWDHCTATHGSLPSDNHDSSRRAGIGFYGHTDSSEGSYAGLIISNGCTVRDTPYGCAAPSGFTNLHPAAGLPDIRCFIVGELFEGGATAGSLFQVGVQNAARVNSRYLNLAPRQAAGPIVGWPAGGWVINCTVQEDVSDASGDTSLFSAPYLYHNLVRFWHCDFRIKTAPGLTFRFDYDIPSRSSGSEVVNCIVVNTGEGVLNPNIAPPPLSSAPHGSPPSAYYSNAYYDVAGAVVATDRRPVLLARAPVLGAAPACGSPLTCGASALAGGVMIGFDQTGVPQPRRTIGPLEPGPCGNCDGSTIQPVLNVLDFACFLNRFIAGDTYANCDGSTVAPVLNVVDFACFLNVISRGCP